jgi:[acyl-carrier-protein] S-malonyltransferase
MGQYSALVAAGSLDLADAVGLVRERGRLMQASGSGREGRMAAVIGLADDRIDDLVERASQHGLVTVANRNSPGQIVVSGERAAIEASLSIAKELGARRAVELPVSVASHSPLMAQAADALQPILAEVEFADPNPPLRANGDGHVIDDADGARYELVDHLTTGVDWVTVVESMAADGVTTFVEVGPGRVLTGLVKRIAPDAEAIATDDPSAPAGLAVPFAPPATVA